MIFQHKLTQRIWELVETEVKPRVSFGNPMLIAIWYALRHELPNMLHQLDENPEAIAYIEQLLTNLTKEDDVPPSLPMLTPDDAQD